MTMKSYSFWMPTSASLSLKGASNCPTSCCSSLASESRAGARPSPSTLVGRITSRMSRRGSASTSYMLGLISRGSKNAMVELAWGSRSISRVRCLRRARAAARLMAVVVLPTPPFWFVMARMQLTFDRQLAPICRAFLHLDPKHSSNVAVPGVKCKGKCRKKNGWFPLHLVTAEIFVVQALQPPPQLFVAHRFGARSCQARALQHVVLDENRAVQPQGQGQRVARPCVDGQRLPFPFHPDQGVEGIVAKVVDDYFLHPHLQPQQNVFQQIVRHRARCLHFLDFQGNRVGLVDPHPDGQQRLPFQVAQNDDRHVGDRVHHEAPNFHFDFHQPTSVLLWCRPTRLCGPACVMSTCRYFPRRDGSGEVKFTTRLPEVRPVH